jgi:hypothetical protein
MVVAGFSLRFLSQTRPKGTQLPGVCIKTGNKDDKMGHKAKDLITFYPSPPIGEENTGGGKNNKKGD